MVKRFRLYIDESGDHTFKNLTDPSKRYLSLTGIIIESENYRNHFYPDLEKLKQQYFPHDPDRPLVLHRKEIINKNGAFSVLADPQKEETFNKAFLDFLAVQEYRLISVAIDKKSHEDRYGDAAWHPYHYCLSVLLERYCGYLNLIGGQGDVMAESRGGSEDMELKRAFKETWASGTNHRNPAFFQSALTSREIKFEKKQANIAGLQVADLVAYPIKQEILIEEKISGIAIGQFGSQICKAIAGKFNKHEYRGAVRGYGKVLIK